MTVRVLFGKAERDTGRGFGIKRGREANSNTTTVLTELEKCHMHGPTEEQRMSERLGALRFTLTAALILSGR